MSNFEEEGFNVVSFSFKMGWLWIYHNEPESKRQSMEWTYTDSPVKKKLPVHQSIKKPMKTFIIDFLKKTHL